VDLGELGGGRAGGSGGGGEGRRSLLWFSRSTLGGHFTSSKKNRMKRKRGKEEKRKRGKEENWCTDIDTREGLRHLLKPGREGRINIMFEYNKRFSLHFRFSLEPPSCFAC